MGDPERCTNHEGGLIDLKSVPSSGRKNVSSYHQGPIDLKSVPSTGNSLFPFSTDSNIPDPVLDQP